MVLKKRFILAECKTILYDLYSKISPLHYIYIPPKEEMNNIFFHIAIVSLHIAFPILLISSISSILKISKKNVFFISTMSLWYTLYRIDSYLHINYPEQMRLNNIILPIPFINNFDGLVPLHERIDMIIHIDGQEDFFNIPNYQQNHGENIIRNDTQNVHDTGVTKTLKQSVNNLQKKTDLLFTKEETLEQLSKLIKKFPDTLIKEKAKKTLETIRKNTIPLVSINMSMLEVIQLFWNRIHSDSFTEEQKKLLEENLIKELADGTTVSIKPVCSTGIVSRIIQSGITIDKEIDIKPKWVLRQELLNQSYQLWKEEYKKLTQKEKDSINTIDPQTKEDIDILQTFKTQLENKIRNKAYSVYVKDGLLQKTEVDKEIDSWIDNII